MAELETPIAEQPIIQERPVVEVKANAFSKDAWSDTPPEAIKKEEEKPLVKIEEPVKPVVTEEEIVDQKEWLKREFEVDDISVIKAEREEYKKLKSQPQQYKFENEDSKRMAEAISKGDRKTILNILETQERLDVFTTGDVTKDTAPEIIKLGMQLSNKLLTKDDIEFKYKQDYGVPKEPVQKATELDEDFAERMDVYKERLLTVEMKKVIDAKMVIPQLEQLKQKIVLPEFEKPKATTQEPTQESLDALKKIRESFLSQLESNFSKVEGFDTKVRYETEVKGEYAEIPVSFKIPDEDKIAIKARLADNFDVENYIGERWFDEKGNPKIELIISDIFELENRDKIHAGIANNSASKRHEEYIKTIKNLDIGKTPQKTFEHGQNGGNTKASPFARDAWVETPPILQN